MRALHVPLLILLSAAAACIVGGISMEWQTVGALHLRWGLLFLGLAGFFLLFSGSLKKESWFVQEALKALVLIFTSIAILSCVLGITTSNSIVRYWALMFGEIGLFCLLLRFTYFGFPVYIPPPKPEVNRKICYDAVELFEDQYAYKECRPVEEPPQIFGPVRFRHIFVPLDQVQLPEEVRGIEKDIVDPLPGFSETWRDEVEK